MGIILVLFNNQMMNHDLILELESSVNYKVMSINIYDIAFDKIDRAVEIDLVICDFDVRNTGELLRDILSGIEVIRPVLFIDEQGSETEEEGTIKDLGITYFSISKMAFLKKAITILGKKICEDENQFRRIKITKIFGLKTSECDLYLKLSSEKFIKILSKDQVIDEHFLQKKHKKNIDFLYVKREDYPGIVEKLLRPVGDNLKATLASSDLEGEQRKDTEVACHKLVKKMVQNIGLSSYSIKLADATIESTKISFKKDKKLRSVIKKILKNRDYLSEHSLLLNYIGTSIVANCVRLNSKENCEKISQAAFFHDILVKNDDLAKIQDLNSQEARSFSEKERQEYKLHPQKTAELISSIKEIPQDVGVIIAQHHERPWGGGFPRGLYANEIKPLSCAFVLAEDFVNRIHKYPDIENKNRVLKELKEPYSEGFFKVVFDSLEKSFI